MLSAPSCGYIVKSSRQDRKVFATSLAMLNVVRCRVINNCLQSLTTSINLVIDRVHHIAGLLCSCSCIHGNGFISLLQGRGVIRAISVMAASLPPTWCSRMSFIHSGCGLLKIVTCLSSDCSSGNGLSPVIMIVLIPMPAVRQIFL
jgi:hypothetical protein